MIPNKTMRGNKEKRMNRKIAAVLVLLIVICAGAYSQTGGDLVAADSLTLESLAAIFNDAYINAKADEGRVVVNENNSIFLVQLNPQEKLISFFIIWTVSDTPMSAQRMNVLNSLIQKWNNERLFARFYIGQDRSIAGDYTLAYEDSVSRKHVINSFKQFQNSVNYFAYKNYQSIKDSYLLDIGNTQDSGEYGVFSFIQYVLNPTMDDARKTVRLENDEFLITHEPDMRYSMLDKKTGKLRKGMHGFETNAKDFSGGTVYYLDLKGKTLTRDEFLDKSGYKDNADIVFIPVKCDEKSVTYKYVKPDSMKGKTITLSITVSDK